MDSKGWILIVIFLIVGTILGFFVSNLNNPKIVGTNLNLQNNEEINIQNPGTQKFYNCLDEQKKRIKRVGDLFDACVPKEVRNLKDPEYQEILTLFNKYDLNSISTQREQFGKEYDTFLFEKKYVQKADWEYYFWYDMFGHWFMFDFFNDNGGWGETNCPSQNEWYINLESECAGEGVCEYFCGSFGTVSWTCNDGAQYSMTCRKGPHLGCVLDCNLAPEMVACTDAW